MGVIDILEQIDREILKLKHASALLRDSSAKTRAGQSSMPFNQPGRKRNLTPEGRIRIAEAVKRRWALQKSNQSAAIREAPATNAVG